MEWQKPDSIVKDSQAADADMQADNSYFLGLSVFQFQQAYQKGGSELNFGIFSLGDKKIGDTDEVCDLNKKCRTWPVYCLNTNLDRGGGLIDDNDHRAEAVARGWNGSALGHGRCTAEQLEESE